MNANKKYGILARSRLCGRGGSAWHRGRNPPAGAQTAGYGDCYRRRTASQRQKLSNVASDAAT